MGKYVLSHAAYDSGSEIFLDDLQLLFFIWPLRHLRGHLSPPSDEVTKTLIFALLSHLEMLTSDLEVFVRTVFGHELFDYISMGLVSMSFEVEEPPQGGSCQTKVESLCEF